MTKLGIVTVSDSRSAGRRDDTTTALIRRLMETAGWTVAATALVPDDRQQIQAKLLEFADEQALPLILTTGGTGLGPRDVTPEATRAVLEREAPGLAEAIRVSTAAQNSLAWLSRATAGLRGRTLIINLPGSPRAVEEGLRVLLPLLPHALDMMEGTSHDPGATVVAHP